MTLPFKRADAGVSRTYALYGKLRNRSDFVRMNADDATAAEFDELIQRAFERVACEEDWEHSYDGSMPVEFQYVSRDARRTFIGVLAPSCDQAGRRYPLVAGAILPAEAITGYAHIVPIAYEVFFDGLREQVCTAIENSVEALSCRQYLETQLNARSASVADLELAKSVVDRFMNATPVSYLNDLLVTDARATTLEQALLNLAFYRAFLRRFDHRTTNQIIQLPLPAQTGERALAASAWLSILQVLWQCHGNGEQWRGSYAMRQPYSAGAELAACFGNSQERMSALMLGSALESSSRLDLCNEQEAWTSQPLYSEMSYALGRLLSDSTLSLQSLCEFLKEMGKRLDGGM